MRFSEVLLPRGIYLILFSALFFSFLTISTQAAYAASLEGDDILVTLETNGESFLGPTQTITVPGSAVFTDGCSTHEVMVKANGEVWIILMSTGSCALNLPFTIWIEDIDWAGQPGQVVGFNIINPGPYDPTVTTTPTSVQVEFPPGSPISQEATSFHFKIHVAVKTIRPQDAVDELTTVIQELIDKEILNKGQGASLISKLENVIKKLNNGQIKASCNQLDAFINQVNAFIKSKTLTPPQGEPIIYDVQLIKVAAGCDG